MLSRQRCASRFIGAVPHARCSAPTHIGIARSNTLLRACWRHSALDAWSSAWMTESIYAGFLSLPTEVEVRQSRSRTGFQRQKGIQRGEARAKPMFARTSLCTPMASPADTHSSTSREYEHRAAQHSFRSTYPLLHRRRAAPRVSGQGGRSPASWRVCAPTGGGNAPCTKTRARPRTHALERLSSQASAPFQNSTASLGGGGPRATRPRIGGPAPLWTPAVHSGWRKI